MSDTKIIGFALPDRRRDRRVMMPPIQIEIAGEAFTTVDWSLGGFLAGPYAGKLKKGESVRVTIIATIRGELHRHPADAEVIRDGRKDGYLAAKFDQLDGTAIDTLERVIMERMRRRPA